MTIPADQSPLGPAAVLFDMDGTLIDSERLWTIALNDYAAHRGGVLSPATRATIVGSNLARSMRIMLEDLGLPAGPMDVDQAAVWVSSRVAELLRRDLSWRPGAQEALRAVRAAGIPTALVTSTIRSLTEIALDTLGRTAFDVTVCGDEVAGRNKPDPEPYLKASRLLGVEPHDCLAVEDSPSGVAAAEAAGCLVIAVPCEVPLEPGPQRILLDSLEEFDPFSVCAPLASVPA